MGGKVEKAQVEPHLVRAVVGVRIPLLLVEVHTVVWELQNAVSSLRGSSDNPHKLSQGGLNSTKVAELKPSFHMAQLPQ